MSERLPELEGPGPDRGHALDQGLEQSREAEGELQHPLDDAAENADDLVEDFARQPFHAGPHPAGEGAETLPDPQHCDKLGSPSYYSKGYSTGHARSES